MALSDVELVANLVQVRAVVEDAQRAQRLIVEYCGTEVANMTLSEAVQVLVARGVRHEG